MTKTGGMSSVVTVGRTIPAHVAAFVACWVSAWSPTEAQGQMAEDSAAIRMRIEAYVASWDEHDARGLGALFSEDADLLIGEQAEARGRQEIQGWWRTYFENQEPGRRLDLDLGPLRFVAPEVAIITFTATTGGRDSQGRDLRPEGFRGSWLWQHQNDGWLISAMRGLPLEEDSVALNASFEAAEDLRPDIRGFVAAYEDALNTQDPIAVSAFYRDDAEIIVRNSPVVSGTEAVHAWWRRYFGEARAYRALLIIDEIRMITPDVALLNITATGEVPRGVLDQPTAVRYARATWLLSLEAGEWQIIHLLVLPSEDDEIIRSGAGSN